MSPAQYTWSSYNLNCQKNENLTSRRASYASNRDKLGSKSSLYQSTSSLHASEQVREAVNYYLKELVHFGVGGDHQNLNFLNKHTGGSWSKNTMY